MNIELEFEQLKKEIIYKLDTFKDKVLSEMNQSKTPANPVVNTPKAKVKTSTFNPLNDYKSYDDPKNFPTW